MGMTNLTNKILNLPLEYMFVTYLRIIQLHCLNATVFLHSFVVVICYCCQRFNQMLGNGGRKHTAELEGNYMSVQNCVDITTDRTKP